MLFVSALIYSACDLDRIPDFDAGNASKFNTSVGGSSNEFPYDILANADGTFIIAGRTQSFTVDQNNQAYLVKLDKNGILLDQANFGYAADDWVYQVVATSDGGYVMAGVTKDPLTLNSNVFIVKANSNLDEVWKFSYGSPDSTESAFGVARLGASDFIVGYTAYAVSGGTSTRVKFMRINANGSRISDKVATSGSLYITDMIKTADGAIAVSGSESISGTSTYTARFDEDGDFIWDQNYTDPVGNFTPTYGITEMADQSLVVAASLLGSSDHDFLLVRYSSIGMEQSHPTWGGANADELLAVTASADDEIVCVGYSNSFSSSNEIYVSKRKKTDGTEIWAKHFGMSWVSSSAIALCPDGGFVLCAGQNAANADIIVVKMDQNGNYE